MAHCSNCGAAVRDEAKYCENCGIKLTVGKRSPEKEPHHNLTDTINPAFTVYQSKRKLTIDNMSPCPFCDCSGQIPGASGMAAVPCPVSAGSPTNLIPSDWVECGNCGGNGKSSPQYINGAANPCPRCKGKGWIAPGS